MSKSSKLAGIELCRGLAALAVIIVHSGDDTWGIPIAKSAIQFRLLFYFAVPFFIASYFYFATRKLPLRISLDFWQKKFRRIVVPYLLWSIIFVLFKSVVFLGNGGTEQLEKLWSDPLAIVFFGGASYHLYFLPLLMSGTLLIYLAKYLIKQDIIVLSLGFVLSIALYQWLITSENSFDMAKDIAFSGLLNQLDAQPFVYPIARIILVSLAWNIRCLPYFFVALLFNHFFKIDRCRWLYYPQTSLLLLLGFILINGFRERLVLGSLSEVAIAYLLLLLGVSISQKISNSYWITSLGLCSFGIYLIHPIIKSIVEIILIKLTPNVVENVSLVSMLFYCIPTFILSWFVVIFLRQQKWFAKYI